MSDSVARLLLASQDDEGVAATVTPAIVPAPAWLKRLPTPHVDPLPLIQEPQP
jgi:hypothetical protein